VTSVYEEPPFRKDEEEKNDQGQEGDKKNLHPQFFENGRLLLFARGFHRSISCGTLYCVSPGGYHRRIRIALSSRFLLAVVLAYEDLASLRIDPRPDVLDRAILAGCVHSLEDREERIAVQRPVEPLQLAQASHVLIEKFLITLLGFGEGLHEGRPFLEFDG
jgi:hypothetical protein